MLIIRHIHNSFQRDLFEEKHLIDIFVINNNNNYNYKYWSFF